LFYIIVIHCTCYSMKDVKAFILGVETQDPFTQSNAFYNIFKI
jgi:hypothetical protein